MVIIKLKDENGKEISIPVENVEIANTTVDVRTNSRVYLTILIKGSGKYYKFYPFNNTNKELNSAYYAIERQARKNNVHDD